MGILITVSPDLTADSPCISVIGSGVCEHQPFFPDFPDAGIVGMLVFGRLSLRKIMLHQGGTCRASSGIA